LGIAIRTIFAASTAIPVLLHTAPAPAVRLSLSAASLRTERLRSI
jgi:hypothetical protein